MSEDTLELAKAWFARTRKLPTDGLPIIGWTRVVEMAEKEREMRRYEGSDSTKEEGETTW